MEKQILEKKGTNLKSKLVAMFTAATMVFAMVPLGAGVAFADEENDEIQDAVVAEMPDPEAADTEFIPEEEAVEAEVLPMQTEEPQVEADTPMQVQAGTDEPQQVQAQATLKDLGTLTVDLSSGVHKVVFDSENMSTEAATFLLFIQIERLIYGGPSPVEKHTYFNLDGEGADYDFELYPEEIEGTSADDAYLLCFKKLDTTNIKDSYTVRMPQEMIDQYKQVEISPEEQGATGFYSAIKFVFNKPAAISINKTKVVLSKAVFTYNGKVQKPLVKTIGGKALKAGTDYTVKWSNTNSKNAGTYTITITGKGAYTGTTSAKYTIAKAANTLKIKAKTGTVKYKYLKKKAQYLGVTKVITFTSKGQGAKTYLKVSGNKKITISKTTGKVKVKKGLKKGAYKVKVKVKAAGTANYKASAAKAVTFTVKIK